MFLNGLKRVTCAQMTLPNATGANELNSVREKERKREVKIIRNSRSNHNRSIDEINTSFNIYVDIVLHVPHFSRVLQMVSSLLNSKSK